MAVGTTFEIAQAQTITGTNISSDFVVNDPLDETWTVQQMTDPINNLLSDIDLTVVSATPEPGSLSVLGLASLGLLARKPSPARQGGECALVVHRTRFVFEDQRLQTGLRPAGGGTPRLGRAL